MDSLHRGNKVKTQKKAREMAKKIFMEPKKYDDVKSKYPKEHFKK